MESLAILPLSQLSFLSPKPPNKRDYNFQPWKQRISLTRFHCNKMFVPGRAKNQEHDISEVDADELVKAWSIKEILANGFGEASPEAKAAKNLHNFFTYVAVKIVTAQLESYNPEAYKELMEFVDSHSMNDGDKFCADLMRESPRHKSLAMRILEVRSAYCKKDFEWDNLKLLASKMADEANTRLMREYVLETSHMEREK